MLVQTYSTSDVEEVEEWKIRCGRPKTHPNRKIHFLNYNLYRLTVHLRRFFYGKIQVFMVDTEPTSSQKIDKVVSPDRKDKQPLFVPQGPLIIDCLEAQTVNPNPRNYKEAVTDEAATLEIVDRHLSQAWVMPRFPDSYCPEEREIKEGFRQGLALLYKHGLVDLQIFRGASQLAGVGNLTANKESANSHLYPTPKFLMGGRRHWGHPQHWQRNEFYGLDIGTAGINQLAREYFDVCPSTRKLISVSEAFRLATISICTHEFGHAIDHALELNGIKTAERADRERMVKYENIDQQQHPELFARGIQEIAVREYLRTTLDYNDENIHAFQQALEARRSKEFDDVKMLFDYGRREGIKLFAIQNIRTAIFKLMRKQYGDRYNFQDIGWVLSYRAPAYTEEQLALLLKK